MAQKIDSWDDVIDSRDVVARIDELVAERDAYTEDPATSAWPWDLGNPDEAAELAQLEALYQELCDVGGDKPEDGQTLVRESYFEEYAQEYWEDTKDHDTDTVSWPYTCIDWEQAARELQMDYTSVEFDDVTYYVR